MEEMGVIECDGPLWGGPHTLSLPPSVITTTPAIPHLYLLPDPSPTPYHPCPVSAPVFPSFLPPSYSPSVPILLPVREERERESERVRVDEGGREREHPLHCVADALLL